MDTFAVLHTVILDGDLNRTADGQQLTQDKLIFFSYLVAFLACVMFNTVDVSLFDLRLNTLGWILLSAIIGVVYNRYANAYSK